MQYIVDDRKSQ